VDPDAFADCYGHGSASDEDPGGVADHGPGADGNRRDYGDACATSHGGGHAGRAERGHDADDNTGAAALERAERAPHERCVDARSGRGGSGQGFGDG
jgi:hypothetical protein